MNDDTHDYHQLREATILLSQTNQLDLPLETIDFCSIHYYCL